MSKKSISIIGCGWLGLPLGALLVEQGYMVRGSTTREEKLDILREKGIEAYQIKVDQELVGERLDAFFSSELLIVNIPPGRRRSDVETAYPREIALILDAAKKGGVKEMIFVSSSSVYPDINDVVTEETPVNAKTNSGKALIAAEIMVRSRTEVKGIILRLSGLIGGLRKPGRFFAGKKDIPGGLVPVNMVHRDDCIAIISQLIKQEIWGETFNVCADEHPTKATFYTAQAQKDQLPAPEFLMEKSAFKIVDNTKIKKYLNYTFQMQDPMTFGD